MKRATTFRAIFPALLVCIFSFRIVSHAQIAPKQPKIGIAIYGGIGVASASSIGFLRALDEHHIPVDVISASGGATLVAALYATGHSDEEMRKAFAEYEGIFLQTDFSSGYYTSDYKIRRFLARKFTQFDMSLGMTPALPIRLITLATDLNTGELILPQINFADTVRASFASPFYLEPVRVKDKILIGEAFGQVAALRNAGADIVIACVDPTFNFDPHFALDQSGLKALVTQFALDARDRAAIQRDLQVADVVVYIRPGFETSYEILPRAIEWGHRAFEAHAANLVRYSLSDSEIAPKRDALTSFYKSRDAVLNNLSIDSVEVKGARYLDSDSIHKILNLQSKTRFDLDHVLTNLDRLYATGFLSRCSFEFQRSENGLVRISLDVKESEFLPLESLPKLEAAIKVHKQEDAKGDDNDSESDDKKTDVASSGKEDDDDEEDDTLFAAIAIGNLGPSAKHAIPRLASLLQDSSPAKRTVAVVSLGAMGREAKSELGSLVGLLTVEDQNLRREAAHAIARISAPLFSDQDIDAIDLLQRAAEVLDKDPRMAEYANSVHVSLSVLKNVQASSLANRAHDYTLSGSEAGSPLSSSGEVVLNGFPVTLDVSADRSHVKFLGSGAKDAIHQGINRLVKGKEDLLFWMEERKLMVYQNPYQNSYAIVVAIDDYDRKDDPHYGGPTGYHALGGMVPSAQALTEALTKLGFPKKNIITLYNEKATSTAVQNVLTSFWPGGANASADRLFFYFGGHGDKYTDNPADKGRTIPYLVTYDFDTKKPTQTTLLMRDLTDRNSQNILAHHVLFALDACDSGLTLSALGSDEAVDQKVRRFQALSLIRRDTEGVARNLLVAGTGDQQALWQNGGLFTRALTEGLKGVADLNNDGVIQFEELAVYVRNRVTAQAAQTQVRQDPEFRVLDQYGTGRILFVK